MYGYQDDGDDGNVDGDDYQETYSNGDNNYNNGVQKNSGKSIQYWTEYAILPKRCIR